MAGMFKNTGDEPNVGMFSTTEFDADKLEKAWVGGKAQADPTKTPTTVSTSSDAGTIFKDVTKRTDDEMNVGMFGPGLEEVGAFQSAWDSANIAKQAAVVAEDAMNKLKDAKVIADRIAVTKQEIDQSEKAIDSDVKGFDSKYLDLKQNVFPEIVNSKLTAETAEREALLAKDAASVALDSVKQLTVEAQNAQREAQDSEHDAQGFANDARLLKESLDRATQDFINNFLNYRGIWDPTTDAYPDPEGGNSVWDINLPDGFTTYVFKGDTWAEGDRLFWYGENHASRKWVHLKSGSGIIVTNLDRLYQKLDVKNKPNGYAGLGADGRVLPSLMPSLSILDINVDHNFYGRNARDNLQKGDISIIKGAEAWGTKNTYKKGDVVYRPDPQDPHSVSKNKFYIAKQTFESKDVFDPNMWLVTSILPNKTYSVGDEVVYKNKLYIVKADYSTGASVIDPVKLPKFFEVDDYIDSGMYILQRSPTGAGGTSVAEDWVSFGSDFRVSSFNGRVGSVVPQQGDYSAAEINTSNFGAMVAANVQDFLEGLEASKVSKLGDKIAGKLVIQNDLDVENIKLTGLGQEGITNAQGTNLIRSGGKGDSTIVGNTAEPTYIDSSTDPVIRMGSGTESKIYHQGFRPNASDVGARDGGWVPSFTEVTAKPETATRWPLWSEVGNRPSLFSGSYLALTDVPTEFTAKAHRHDWGDLDNKPAQATRWASFNEVTSKPDTATRWPSWNEVTGKPSGILNQAAYDTRYLKVGDTSVNSQKLDNVSLEEFYRPDSGQGGTPAALKVKNSDDGRWLHITRRDGNFLNLEDVSSRDENGISKSFFSINSSGIFYNPTLGSYGTGYKVYHEGNKPNSSDVKARPDNWVPSWAQVTSKPDTATRWPFWREIPDKPAFFSGNYNDLAGKPATFTPSAHRHKWSELDGIPSAATRWAKFSEVTGKPDTATRWPKWSEISEKPTNHLTQDRVGSSLNGLILSNTSDGTKPKYPLSIRRTSTDREKLDMYVGDTSANFDYTNDETGSTVRFNMVNTGFEGNNQAKANNGTILFEQSGTGTNIKVNNYKVYHQGFRPTPQDINAHPNTWVPSWSEVTSKPAQATRWPSWSEVTGKPTNHVTTGSDAVFGSHVKLKAGSNEDSALELNEANEQHGIRLFYEGSDAKNYGYLQGKSGNTYANIFNFPRTGGWLNVTGQVRENNKRVYSPNNIPSTAILGVYSKSETDGKYLGKTSKAVDSDKLDGKDSSVFISGTNGFGTNDQSDFVNNRKSSFIGMPNSLSKNKPGRSNAWAWGWQTSHTGNGASNKYGSQFLINQDNKAFFRVQSSSGAGTWREFYHTGFKPTAADVGAITKAQGDIYYLGKTATSSNSSKLENATKAQIIAASRSGLAVQSSVDATYLKKSGGNLTGDLSITKTNGKVIFNETAHSSGNSGIEFKTVVKQNVFMSHEVSDKKVPAPGQAILFKSSGSATASTHIVTDGEFFAQNNKKVYHTGNKPSASDVGAYTKSESNSKFAPKSHTHKMADISDRANQTPENATSLGNTIDLNSLSSTSDSGFYYQGSNAYATTAHHYPVAQAGSLFVQKAAGVTQTYTTYGSNRRVYVRGYYNKAWSDWAEMYSTARKPTSADVGALTKTQGDGYYLGKTATATNSAKLDNKSYAQVIAAARSGLAATSYGYSKSESDSKFLGKTSKAVSATVADTSNKSKANFSAFKAGMATNPNTLSCDSGGFNYTYNHNKGTSNLFPTTNNANGILTFNTHSGNFYHQLGFSSNGAMYARGTKTGSWGKLYTSTHKPTAAEVGALTKSQGDSYYLGKTAKAVSAVVSDTVGKTNLGKTLSGYLNVVDNKWWGDSGVGTSQMLKSTSKGVPNSLNGYAFKIGARDSAKGHSWLFASDYNGNGNLYFGTNPSGSKAPLWHKVFSTNNKPTLTDVGLSNISVTSNKTLKVQSKYGYLTLGSENTSHMHFGTDRSNFYFNKMLRVNGDVQLYSHSDTKMSASNGFIYEKGKRVYSENNKPKVADVLIPTTASKDLALTANAWTKLLGKTDGLTESGVYQILVSYSSSGKGGVSYSQSYTGQFFWYAGGTNQVDESEITLHNMGHADNGEFIYLRTLTKTGNKGDQEVQIKCNKAITKAVTFTVKLVKLM